MSARLLLYAALLAVVLSGANCAFNPTGGCADHQNLSFEGCFEGEITAPAGSGKVMLILNTAGMPGTRVLSGCADLSLPTGDELVSLAGEVQCGGTNAKLQGLRANGLTLKLNVLRQPATGNAVTVNVSTEDGTPFATALALPRCMVPAATCLDIGMRVPFGSGGQP